MRARFHVNTIGRWLGDPTRRGLLALVAVAAGLRLAAVWLLADATLEHVAYEHGEIAENLVAGRGFTVQFLGAEGPTSQQAPLYPALLAASYLLFGVGSAAAHLAVLLLQVVVGAVAVAATALAVWALLPAQRWLGWSAAAIAAMHPVQIYMVTQLQVVVWVTCLLACLLALAARSRTAGTVKAALATGTVGGVLLLFEPIMVLAVLVAAVSVAWPRHGSPVRVARGATMLATACLVIAPWLIRNYRVHAEAVFIKSTFGYAFWQGNHPASWGTDKIPKPSAETLRQRHDGTLVGQHQALWEARHETLYIDDVVLSADDYAHLGKLSEPARARVLGRQAARSIRRDPWHYVRLCGLRLKYLLLFDETNPKARAPLYRVTTVTWLVLAFVGFLASRRFWRPLLPAIAVVALVGAFHVLTIYSARFRIPLEPLTFPWVATAVVPPMSRILRRLRREKDVDDEMTEAEETSAPVLRLPGSGTTRHDKAA